MIVTTCMDTKDGLDYGHIPYSHSQAFLHAFDSPCLLTLSDKRSTESEKEKYIFYFMFMILIVSHVIMWL